MANNCCPLQKLAESPVRNSFNLTLYKKADLIADIILDYFTKLNVNWVRIVSDVTTHI